ncbi:orotidine-5'-phosphate decarboxylase [Nanoarchaeota archaeon]|nr:MAG: orotidine-5'-phosphate decarboxylase [Nanoarchaeota archaeon]
MSLENVVSSKNFADRLLPLIDRLESPISIGLDPRIMQIPEYIREQKIQEFGDTKKAVAEAFFEFNKRIIDATFDLVPVYKPNAAFLEKYLSDGVEALEKTINYIKAKGRIAVVDAKRNDIGSTAKAYADAWLGEVELCSGRKESGFNADAITINAYLGSDCVNPFAEECKKGGKGVFVLTKTSNKSAGELQDKELAEKPNWVIMTGMKERVDRKTVYTEVAELVNRWGRELIGECGYSAIGAVVGATYPKDMIVARKLMPNAIILIPGYGAQGGKAEDVVNGFDEEGFGAIVNSSRGIIFAYQREPYKKRFKPSEFDRAAREAALDMINDIKSALKKAGKSPW